MIEKYKQAIVAGIICGIVLVILSFLYFTITGLLNSGQITDISAAPVIFFFVTIVVLVLDVFTFFFSGLLSARLAKGHILKLNDAAVQGAIAAAAGELINLPFTLIFSFLAAYIWPPFFTQYTTNTSPVVFATISAMGQLICCFPVLLVVGIIISILGALAYAFITLKA